MIQFVSFTDVIIYVSFCNIRLLNTALEHILFLLCGGKLNTFKHNIHFDLGLCFCQAHMTLISDVSPSKFSLSLLHVLRKLKKTLKNYENLNNTGRQITLILAVSCTRHAKHLEGK